MLLKNPSNQGINFQARSQELDSKLKVELPFIQTTFPIFANLQRLAKLPKLFSIFNFYWSFFSDLLITNWLITHQKLPKYEELIISILLFVGSSDSQLTTIILASIIIIIQALVIIFTVSLIITYKKTGSAPFAFYKIVDFLLHFVMVMLIRPLAGNVGALIWYYSQTKNTAYLILSIIGFIVYIMVIVLFYFDYVFVANSIDIINSYMMCYDYIAIFLISILQSAVLFASYISRFAPESAKYLVISIYILIALYNSFRISKFPFARYSNNIIIISGYIGTSIVSIYFFFDPIQNDLIRLGIQFAVCIVVLTILFIFFKWYHAKILSVETPESVKQAMNVILLSMKTHSTHVKFTVYADYLSQNISETQDRLQLARLTSYFPDRHAFFVAQVAMLRNSKDLSIGDSYLLYVLKRIEISRGTNNTVEELYSLKAESQRVANAISDAWIEFGKGSDLNGCSIFDGLSSKLALCHRSWSEALMIYPRNAILAEEYSKFLIECESDFSHASEWSFRSIQLGEGKIFDYDPSHVAFLMAYPKFAEKILQNQKLSSIEELDARNREKILSGKISYPRLRLEFGKTIGAIRPRQILWLKILAYARVFFFFGVWIAMYFYYGALDSRINSIQFIYNVTDLGLNTAKTLLPIFGEVANILSLADFSKIDDRFNELDQGHDLLINWSSDLNKHATNLSNDGLTALSFLISEFIIDTADTNMEIVVDNLLAKRTPIVIYQSLGFDKFVFFDTGLSNIRTAILYFFESTRKLSQNINIAWQIDKGSYLQAIVNSNLILRDIEPFAQSFVDCDKHISEEREKVIVILIEVLSVIAVILFVFVFLAVFFSLRHRIKVITKSFSTFKESSIEAASQPLVLSNQRSKPPTTSTINTAKTASNKTMILALINIMLTVIVVILISMMYVSFHTYKVDLDEYVSLSKSMTMRKMLSVQIITNILETNIVYQFHNDKEYLKNQTDVLSKAIIKFRGYDKLCSRLEFPDSAEARRIEEIRNRSPCRSNISEGTGHDYYSCLPMNSAVEWYIEKVYKIQAQLQDPGLLSSDSFIDTAHMALNHLYFSLDEIPLLVATITKSASKSFNNLVLIIGSIGIVVALVIFIFDLYLTYQLDRNFKSIISFILRLPPIEAIENSQLINQLLEKQILSNTKLSISSRLIMHSKNPVALLNKAFLIDAINPAFPITLGYDLSHIIGQDISCFICDEKFVKQLEKQQTVDVVTKELTCRKENGTEILCSVTLVPVLDEKTHIVQCYAMIIIDLSAIEEKSKKADELRKKNERMLEEMMPKILEMTENGQIQNCAVCCIRIHSYGESKSTILNAKRRQAMYKRFDEVCTRFQTITRVLYFNSIYIAVGIPKRSTLTQEHYSFAVDIVNFAFNIAELFERSQVLGNFSIGIDIGGPLLAALTTGERKKLLLSGEVMTNSEKLSGIAKPGSIIISDKVYTIVAKRDLMFERNEDENGVYYHVEQKMKEILE